MLRVAAGSAAVSLSQTHRRQVMYKIVFCDICSLNAKRLVLPGRADVPAGRGAA